MIALYIIGGIVVLLIGLCCIKGALVLSCRDLTKVSLSVNVAGFRILSLPTDPTRIKIADYSRAAMERKARREQKKQLKKAKKGKNKGKESDKPTQNKTGSTWDTVSLIIAMVRSVLSRLGHNSKIVIRRWHLTIATDDAAKTALLYAAAQNGTNFLFALLDEYTKVVFPHDGNRYVTADFAAQKCSIDAELRFEMRVGQALRLLLCTAVDFLKYKQTNKKEG